MMAVTQNNVYVHTNPPKAISGHGAAIRTWVKNGDLDKLENVVLEGQGARLLGLMESTNDLKVKTFLKSIPGYMAKVDLIHDAVIRGSLRETQSLIDKRKLATARDAVGRGLAHKAVLYNHKSVLEWLAKKYPETIHLRDNEGRTSLHYTAFNKDPSELYESLVKHGANPESIDIHGRKPTYYLNHPQELDIEGPQQNRNNNTGGGMSRGYSRNQQRLSRRISPISPKTPHAPTPTSNIVTTPTMTNSPSSITRAQIRIWIHERDIKKLEKIVWSGMGDKLLLETTNNSKVRRFLDNVPHLLSLIKQIHTASIHNDVDKLKQYRLKTQDIAEELFTAKDSYGLTPLHKAAGLGNRATVEYLLYEVPLLINEVDNEGRVALHYSKDESMYSFLVKNGADQTREDNKFKVPSYYLKHLEVNHHLRNIPDAPRVSGEIGDWDRNVSSSDSNNKTNYKRKISTGEFDDTKDNDVIDKARDISSKFRRTETGTEDNNREEYDDEDEMINDVNDGYVADSDEGTKYELGTDFEIQPMEMDNNDELDKELVHLVTPTPTNDTEDFNDRQDNYVEESGNNDEESVQQQLEAVGVEEPVGVGEGEEEPVVVEEEEIGLSDIQEPNDNKVDELFENEYPSLIYDDKLIDEEQNVEEGVEGGGGGDSENNKSVEEYIESGDMEKLVELVLEGRGNLLLNKESNVPEVSEFLSNVPAYMAKIASIHSAAGSSGNLRDLQSLLDRKRLAQAKDELGRVPLHQAVLFNHPHIVRYLASTYPQSINMLDMNKRSPLHYAATLNDQGGLYKVLIQAGSDPNVKDSSGNTPGIYLRRKDMLTTTDLINQVNPNNNKMKSADNKVDSWQRPASVKENILSSGDGGDGEVKPMDNYNSRLTSRRGTLLHPSYNNELEEDMELEDFQLNLLTNFYLQISREETVWSRTWKRLTSKKGTTDIAKAYVRRYLTPEVFNLIKTRSTPRYGATLLDCIKFYPQFFIVAPDPHAYNTFREVFLPAIADHNGFGPNTGIPVSISHPHICFNSSGELGLCDPQEIEVVDLPSKFVSQVRIRVSRNIRPYPFVSILRKEVLHDIQSILSTHINKQLPNTGWDLIELEHLEREDRELIQEKRGLWFPEATKISRFWPKARSCYINEDNSLSIWINGQDHLDFIVQSRYGRLGLMLQNIHQLYTIITKDLDFHYNSQTGFLTVDPFQCGTGFKITFRLRLPYLMSSRSELTRECELHNLYIKWNHNHHGDVEDISPDDWIELENIYTFGLNENEIAKKTAHSVNELIKIEEQKSRAADILATAPKKLD